MISPAHDMVEAYHIDTNIEVPISFPDMVNPVLIQVGAHTGDDSDLINMVMTQHIGSCTAILIEPSNGLFNTLHEKYHQYPNITTLNVAISDIDGESIFNAVDNRAITELSIPEWVSGLGSFDKHHIISHFPGLESYIIEQTVKTVTLDSVIREHNITHIDLLQIDTEGWDYKVFNTLDLEKVAPTVIIFEYNHISIDEFTMFADTLTDNGYKLYWRPEHQDCNIIGVKRK